MDKQTFQFKIAQAGYSPEEVAQIESILRRTASIPVSQGEIRDAAFRYLVVCRDVDKLIGYLRIVDTLSRGYAIEWTVACRLALYFIGGWWKP